VAGRLPPAIGSELMERGSATAPYGGAPIQFVDVFPLTPDRKAHLCPPELDAEAPGGLYAYRPDPATGQYPLALISPASEKTVSSTLGELRERAAKLQMHPSDAAARKLSEGDPARVFNALGEVQVPVAINREMPAGTVSLPKGLWRKSTYNGSTANALAPDTLTDIGGGACFNDARVEVALLGRH
jgi:anaerobic selenocysteine-containing dehydrogenase